MMFILNVWILIENSLPRLYCLPEDIWEKRTFRQSLQISQRRDTFPVGFVWIFGFSFRKNFFYDYWAQNQIYFLFRCQYCAKCFTRREHMQNHVRKYVKMDIQFFFWCDWWIYLFLDTLETHHLNVTYAKNLLQERSIMWITTCGIQVITLYKSIINYERKCGKILTFFKN